ncbi:leucyl aminopeptidase [bacterium]|nr:leucyl aminopeptidase [bacterium]|tara:strand:+ start:829 stop:2226 length:1398 start_codon:yes stop_codon:yes gene_type:complete
MKLTTTKKDIGDVSRKYVRLESTSGKGKSNCLHEGKTGILTLHVTNDSTKEDCRKLRTFLKSAIAAAKLHGIEHLAVQLAGDVFPSLDQYGEKWFWKTVAENFILAEYSFEKYKSKKKDNALKEILICGGLSKAATNGLKEGQIIAEAMNLTRDVANTPALDMTPSILANVVKRTFAKSSVKVEVLGEGKLRKLKANLLLAVGQGTKEETRLIVMKYSGGRKSESPLVLVGKGITYDTGGLNIKPSGGMHEMHMDMSGGASVLGALKAISDLNIRKNVIGIIPAAENAVSDKSMRAGDIVTSMSGKTVEILHTDAEGRLVLADALTFAQRFKPKVIIDVATLTGASLVALGQHTSALMTNDEQLGSSLRTWGEEVGDLVWPLPIWDEYKQHIISSRADISNIANNFSRYGGAIEGGVFLSHFIPKRTKWAHIDMAPRMNSVASDKLAKGATGEPVRLLVKASTEL